jgi:sialidase-1
MTLMFALVLAKQAYSGPVIRPIGVGVDVFVSAPAGKVGGYPQVRGPAIYHNGSGRLVAVCEGRKSGEDESSNILIARVSEDHGRTWGIEKVLVGDGVDSYVSPMLVGEGNTVQLHYNVYPFGTDSYRVELGFAGKYQRSYRMSSSDGGKTWGAPVETSRQVKADGVQSLNYGPGAGLVLTRGAHRGRWILPAHNRIGGAAASVAVVSDDKGATWRAGSAVPAPAGMYPNEVTMAELEDGQVLLNARAAGGIGKRVQSVSSDGGLTWSEAKAVEALVDPVCHASLLRWRFGAGLKKGVLIFAQPGASGRQHGQVRVSLDDGVTWPGTFQVMKGYFGYSVLVDLGGGEVGLLYEGANGSASDPAMFLRFMRLKVMD